MDKIKIGVVTASDRASAGIYDDISGKAIMDTFNEYLLMMLSIYIGVFLMSRKL